VTNAAGTLSSASSSVNTDPERAVLSPLRRERWWLIVRLGVYVIAASLLLEAAVLAARAGHSAGLAIEDGPLEAVQVIIASFACTAFFFASMRHAAHKTLYELCALALVAFAVRELDNYLDEQIVKGAYMYLLVPVLAGAAVVAYRGRKSLALQMEAYVVTPSATLMLFGVFILLCYAQVIGQPDLWLAMSSTGDGDMEPVRRAVEEISEAPGYLFFLFGSIEALIGSRGQSVRPDGQT
jgi:hypothetical protein